jgi:hypothetical protein
MNKFSKEVLLVHGIKDIENKFIRRAQLKILDGYDEEFLNTMESKDLPFPVKTSYVLCRIASFENKDYDETFKLPMVKNLTIGDRVLLILHLRQILFGDTIPIDLRCRSCNEFMSIELSINAILDHFLSMQDFEYTLDRETGFYLVKFSDFVIKLRLLNGLDQENIFFNNLNEKEIIETCLGDKESMAFKRLKNNDGFKEKINSDLSKLDPLSDIILNMTCPFCKYNFKVPFIAEDFFFKEIRSRKNNLDFEIHRIALNYHWSETEILSLPLSKRKRYVKLLDNSLGETNNG